MNRGEIWSAIWPNDPLEKLRPILIVSNNYRNSTLGLKDIIVLKITSVSRTDGSLKYINRHEDMVIMLKKKSIIQAGAIFSIEKKYLRKFHLRLTYEQINEVDARLKTTLALN